MQKELYLNNYTCPRCFFEWKDLWDCQVDDTCKDCGLRAVTPLKSFNVKDIK